METAKKVPPLMARTLWPYPLPRLITCPLVKGRFCGFPKLFVCLFVCLIVNIFAYLVYVSFFMCQLFRSYGQCVLGSFYHRITILLYCRELIEWVGVTWLRPAEQLDEYHGVADGHHDHRHQEHRDRHLQLIDWLIVVRKSDAEQRIWKFSKYLSFDLWCPPTSIKRIQGKKKVKS